MINNRVVTLIIISAFYSTPSSCYELIKKDSSLSKSLTIHYDGKKPIIEIEKMNIQGVSHNYYENFNIGKEGALLTFGKGNSPTTVINEVTSSNESVLKGKLSVEGRAVNMIIANPNGITCSNCDFDNIGKLTFITGFTNSKKPMDFFIPIQSNITFITKNKMMYDDISIVSHNILFKGDGSIYANKMKIINDNLIYNLYGFNTPKYKVDYNAETSIEKRVTLNVHDFSVISDKSNFINRGVINVGRFTLESNAMFKNFKEINIQTGRILPLLTMFDIKEKYEINTKTHSRIKSTIFSNNKGAKFTVYKTNLDVELSEGDFINKGNMRFEHSDIDFKVKNVFQKEDANLVNIFSLVNLNIDDRVDLNGKIHSVGNDVDDKIRINRGSIINIHTANQDKVISKIH
ncbi:MULTISPECIES: two-partner secretion domain-containing protein [Enterobacterales]|uniref:two-partner secretion domain-containing protein n=1 Tax=Enterobacterales TaxID=91347 RepID=UPI00084810E5|nr:MULTISPECIES: filamentous hemagglutinin N-terminal domain-containing protein [Enterobacterales]ODQ07586.1 hypothetical protein BGK50_15235 [Shigella sp. FC130]OEI95129.1 hypothetical protein BHE86_14230 [Shigella sp. FC1655]WOO48453.1 filamentous hemagglutinin N-terminal domain-containing protein [Hafnia alvei]WPF02918.1 filamentous hemagglutinin N-terminal domain-containing protein [Proteus vulgaris]